MRNKAAIKTYTMRTSESARSSPLDEHRGAGPSRRETGDPADVRFKAFDAAQSTLTGIELMHMPAGKGSLVGMEAGYQCGRTATPTAGKGHAAPLSDTSTAKRKPDGCREEDSLWRLVHLSVQHTHPSRIARPNWRRRCTETILERDDPVSLVCQASIARLPLLWQWQAEMTPKDSKLLSYTMA